MRDIVGPNTILGYCTNVHAGAGLAQSIANLQHYLPAVKAIASPDEPLGAGLWFSNDTLGELSSTEKVAPLLDGSPVSAGVRLSTWLRQQEICPFTLNGFPFGDFHEAVVKHRVYEPDWTRHVRRRYTCDLAILLAGFQQGPFEGSISTLPIGWGAGEPYTPECLAAAAGELIAVVEVVSRLHGAGYLIHLDLEPEPGCILQRADDVVRFFARTLLPIARKRNVPDEQVRTHLRVCHDVCHSAVMFEDQAEALAKFRGAGIKVGKVQISSAVRVPFDEMSEPEQREAFRQLQGFNEPRYLHQTMIRTDDGRLTFFEDLPLALQEVERGEREMRGEWRVHFHVPVFLEKFGLIQTTQSDIAACLRAIRTEDQIHHFEVETYAWNVLPPELQASDLAEGIARELIWVKDQAAAGAFK